MSSKYLFPVDNGVLLRPPRSSIENSSSDLPRSLLGVCSTFGIISPSTVLCALLGVSEDNRSKSPRTSPSFCGVGPMIEGTRAGVRSLEECVGAFGWAFASMSSFFGVLEGLVGRLDGVRNISSTLFRFPGAFEGVCGPDLSEIMSRILLYSLYFCEMAALALISSRPALRPS